MSDSLIQVNVSGYQGDPVTILCVADEYGLVVLKQVSYKTERVGDEYMMVTYSPINSNGDVVFTDKDIVKAIGIANELYAMKMIGFEPSGVPNKEQFDPRQRMQVLKVSESGKDYQIAADISNAQMSVLCASWAYHISGAQSSIADFAEEIDDVQDDYFFV